MAYDNVNQGQGTGKDGDTANFVTPIAGTADGKVQKISSVGNHLFTKNILDQSLLRAILGELKVMNHHLSLLTESGAQVGEE